MKVAGYIMLHYGAEYLDACIRSMHNHLDKLFILYSDKPTHGTATSEKCPESERELKDIAYNASNKVDWVKMGAQWEGQHRDTIFGLVGGYDMLITADADEVWDELSLEKAIKTAYEGNTRRYGIDGFINFWRSFNEVCYDGFRPVRIFNLGLQTGESVLSGRIYHFGTAQRADIMRYKYLIHGHASEIRPNWLNDVYFNTSANINLHPVANGIWNSQPFDKSVLPYILQSHPNFSKDIIL